MFSHENIWISSNLILMDIVPQIHGTNGHTDTSLIRDVEPEIVGII